MMVYLHQWSRLLVFVVSLLASPTRLHISDSSPRYCARPRNNQTLLKRLETIAAMPLAIGTARL